MPRLVPTLLLIFFLAAAVAEAAPPANLTPPAIDDASPAVGDTLHAGGDTWDDPQATVTYRWRRCPGDETTCADIQGATGSAYTVVADDAGKRLQVRATATNAGAESAASDSALTQVVPPHGAAKPAITGTLRSGQTLTAQDGTWTGAVTVTRQWLRCDASGGACGEIAGQAGPTLLLGDADEGHTIRVRETASNDGGQASAESDPTALVPAPVRNVSPPVITGAPVVGSNLVSSAGTWSGTPPFVLTRRWQRCPGDASTCADVPGRVSDTYTVEAADVGNRIRVVVNASNDGGSTSAASALTDPVTVPTAGGSSGPPPSSPPPATTPPPAATPSGGTPLTASFSGRPRLADLARALKRKLRIRGRCSGPCKVAVRLTVTGRVARKWRVPRTVAKGGRALAAAGTAVVRPRFAETTRQRLRPVRRLVVVVTAQARDGAGKLVARRSWKLTLAR